MRLGRFLITEGHRSNARGCRELVQIGRWPAPARVAFLCSVPIRRWWRRQQVGLSQGCALAGAGHGRLRACRRRLRGEPFPGGHQAIVGCLSRLFAGPAVELEGAQRVA